MVERIYMFINNIQSTHIFNPNLNQTQGSESLFDKPKHCQNLLEKPHCDLNHEELLEQTTCLSTSLIVFCKL